jgi:hypothetical protein
VAVVAAAGERCPIHRQAQQGPYAAPCEGCGEPITAADLWVRAARPERPHDGASWPWHDRCRPGAPTPLEKGTRRKKGWEHGLALFEATP